VPARFLCIDARVCFGASAGMLFSVLARVLFFARTRVLFGRARVCRLRAHACASIFVCQTMRFRGGLGRVSGVCFWVLCFWGSSLRVAVLRTSMFGVGVWVEGLGYCVCLFLGGGGGFGAFGFVWLLFWV